MKLKTSWVRPAWEQLRTVPGLGRNTAAVAVMLVLGVVVTSVLLSSTTFVSPFDDRFTFAAEFSEAPGTNPDSTHIVTIAGVEVGKIDGWRETERGTAVIEMNIGAEHVIHDNARAVLRSTGPLNQMYIEINPGSAPSEPLSEGSVIPVGQTDRPIQADEVLEHLDDRSRNALTALLNESDVALARAPEHLPGGLRATDDALVGLRPVVAALRTRREKIAELTTALSRIATATGGNQERVVRLAETTRKTLSVLAANDDELRATLKRLPGLNDKLSEALTGSQKLTEQLDPTLDNLADAADSLPAALERSIDTTKRIGAVVDQARPVVDKARPVVADLRPLIRDVDAALNDALPVTAGLDGDTKALVKHREDLRAFVFNTSSVMSVADARSPFARGHLVVPLPDGGVLPGVRGGHAPDEDREDRRKQGSN